MDGTGMQVPAGCCFIDSKRPRPRSPWLGFVLLLAGSAGAAQPPVMTPASPAEAAVVSGGAVHLQVNVADPDAEPLTIQFYGRPVPPAVPAPDFTLVAIPDTQFYSEGAASKAQTLSVEQLIQTFGAQTQWVVDQRGSRNIAFVSHMGDIVQSGNFGGNPVQWQRASAAMARLENPLTTLHWHGIPYGLAPGNHDIDPIGAYDTGSTRFFNEFFGTGRFAGRGYYGGHYGADNTNNYQLFSAAGLDFIALHLAYDTTPNADILDWADAVLKAHPHRRALVTSHWIIGKGNPAAFSTQGAAIYERLKGNPNLFLMLGGHIHAEGRRSDTHQGRTVHSVLSDYQGLPNGGNGFLRTFTFSPARNRIRIESWSPTLQRSATAADGLPHFDGSYELAYDMQTPVSDWLPLGSQSVPAGSSRAVLTWSGLEPGKHYAWKAVARDALHEVGSVERRLRAAAATPPQVSLRLAGDGVLASPATVTLSAQVSDPDGDLARVDFYNGDVKIGEASAAPYEFRWPRVAAGSYTLSALAFDATGQATRSAPVQVQVALGDQLPVVRLTTNAPAGALATPISLLLQAEASDAEGHVVQVEFFDGVEPAVRLGVSRGEPHRLLLPEVTPGTHTFTARVTDGARQVVVSEAVVVDVFTEPAPPNPARFSVGTFDLPAWSVAEATPAPWQFNDPGGNVGDLALKVNGAAVSFRSGLVLANNWSGPASLNQSSRDNLCLPYMGDTGNAWISVLDNSNGNASNANPATSEETAGVAAVFLPYDEGFIGASVLASGERLAGNLPAGISVSKGNSPGLYLVSGLSTAGQLLVFPNGNGGSSGDNVASVRSSGNQWILDVRDNAGTGQDGDFSFLYLPPATPGVYAGWLSSAGSLLSATEATLALGVLATPGVDGLDLRLGDGSLVHPGNAALFVSADSTQGGASSAAADNLISWSANGSSYRIFTQDLPGTSGTHQPISLRFLVVPYAPAESPPSVSLRASDAFAGEFGDDSELRFSVRRSGSLGGVLEVPLTFGGTAMPGLDYVGLPARVTLAVGQDEAGFSLRALADALGEGPETVRLRLGSGAGYRVVEPESTSGTIADHPAQSWLAQTLAGWPNSDPGDDADGDGLANLAEYYLGSSPADAGAFAVPSIRHLNGQARLRYPRARDRLGVQGLVEWSTDLRHWRRSGQSLGALTILIHENTLSGPGQDPEIIEASASAVGRDLPLQLFLRLRME